MMSLKHLFAVGAVALASLIPGTSAKAQTAQLSTSVPVAVTGTNTNGTPKLAPTASIAFQAGSTVQMGNWRSYNGCTYLSLASNNTDTPSATDSNWQLVGCSATPDASATAQASTTCPFSNATNICLTLPPYNADNTGSTDSTSAMLSALNALSSTGGTIYLPCGNYTMNGALQDTSGANAVLPMPKIANYTTPLLDITIQGCMRPNWESNNQTTSISTNVTSGNFIGGYDSAQGGGWPGFTDVKLHVRDMHITLPNSSNAVAINATYLMALDLQHVLFNCGTNCGSGSWAAKFPTLGNEVQNFADDVQQGSFYNGYLITEHTRIGSIYSSGGTNCFVFDTGPNTPGSNGTPSTYMGNSISIQYLWELGCTNAIVGGSLPTTVNIQTADIELPQTYGISDPGNNLRGVINVHNPYSPFVSTPVNGATKVQINYLDALPGANGSSTTITSGNFSVANSTGSSYFTAGDSSSSYANDGYTWSANGAHQLVMLEFNTNNDSGHSGVWGLKDNAVTSSSSGLSPYPVVYNPTTGDLCFQLPYSAVNTPAQCSSSSPFVLHKDGTSSGFGSGSATATSSTGTTSGSFSVNNSTGSNYVNVGDTYSSYANDGYTWSANGADQLALIEYNTSNAAGLSGIWALKDNNVTSANGIPQYPWAYNPSTGDLCFGVPWASSPTPGKCTGAAFVLHTANGTSSGFGSGTGSATAYATPSVATLNSAGMAVPNGWSDKDNNFTLLMANGAALSAGTNVATITFGGSWSNSSGATHPACIVQGTATGFNYPIYVSQVTSSTITLATSVSVPANLTNLIYVVICGGDSYTP